MNYQENLRRKLLGASTSIHYSAVIDVVTMLRDDEAQVLVASPSEYQRGRVEALNDLRKYLSNPPRKDYE